MSQRLLTIVAALGAVACSPSPATAPKPPTLASANPSASPAAPPPASSTSTPEALTGEPLETGLDPAAFHVLPVDRATVDWEVFVEPMNARTDDERVIYRGHNGCFVLVVDETHTKPSTVPCPKSMRSGHWAQCPGGTLVADADHRRCLCHPDGSPPPPPHLQDCPAPPPIPEQERDLPEEDLPLPEPPEDAIDS